MDRARARGSLGAGALLAALLAVGCSGGEGGAADAGPSDVAEVAAPLASFGAACRVDSECLTGLCLASDHAPTPWCARPCQDDGEFCPSVDGEVPAVCIEYPDASGDPLGEGFRSRGDLRRFCAPWCTDDAGCRALLADFVCLPPEFRGNPLYPDWGQRICRGATIGGYTGDDPVDCAGWADGAREAEAVAVCASYCRYLAVCRELPDGADEDCCGRDCYADLTAGGGVDPLQSRAFSCFIDYFNAFRGTALVCSEPRDRCGEPPVPE